MNRTPDALYKSEIRSLPLLNNGKVRDIFAVDDDHMLIVTTDRISAFDVILPDPIPGKGAVLTVLSSFWFDRTGHIIRNHLSDRRLEEVLTDSGELAMVQGRGIIVHRLKPLPVEAIVRGYIIGSGWKDYQKTGSICGISLPAGLRQAERLPQPIFTPSTKAELGVHDENISFNKAADLLGRTLAEQVRDTSLRIYQDAAEYARKRGIIIADTKFEFGLYDGNIILIDEVLTPDSSRFWPAGDYAPGRPQKSFDKQFVRDYLEEIRWNKQAPAPSLPDWVAEATKKKYLEAFELLTGRKLQE